jgi:hypothetical protein
LGVVAEQLVDDTSKNMILETMLSKSREMIKGERWYPGLTTVKIIYDGTTSGSPARRLMVDFFASFGGEKWLTPDLGIEAPREFLYDLSMKFLAIPWQDRRLNSTNTCEPSEYHENRTQGWRLLGSREDGRMLSNC